MSSLNDIRQEAIRNIDQQINRQLEGVRFLRSTRNRLVPISRLHQETLLSIFELFCFSSEKPARGKCQIKPQLAITWISQQWRESALNHPKLWNYIDYLRPTELLEAIIPRGERAKLEIDILIQKQLKEDREVAPILNALPHTHSLRITTAPFPYSWSNEKITLNSLPEWKTATNALTTLSLSNVCLPDGMLDGHCASLIDLELICCQIPWKTFPSLPGLTSMKVSSPTEKASIVDVVRALCAMPRLQKLHLEDIFSNSQDPLDPAEMDVESPAVDDESVSDLLSDSDDEAASKPNVKEGSDIDNSLGSPQADTPNDVPDKPDTSSPPNPPNPVLLQLKDFSLVQSGEACRHLSAFLARLKVPRTAKLDITLNKFAEPLPIFEGLVKLKSSSDPESEWKVRSIGIVTERNAFKYTFEDGGGRTTLRFGHSPTSMEAIIEALSPLKFTKNRPLSIELDGVQSYPSSPESFVSFFETLGAIRVSSLIMHQAHTTPFLAFIEKQIEKSPKIRVQGRGGTYYRSKPVADNDSEDETPDLFRFLRNLHFRKGFARGAAKNWKVLLRWLTNYREGSSLHTLTFEDFEAPPSTSMMEEFRKEVKEVVLM